MGIATVARTDPSAAPRAAADRPAVPRTADRRHPVLARSRRLPGRAGHRVAEDPGRQGRGRSQVRIWVPGCASGEEVYSLAILLKEMHGPAAGPSPKVQIFGTDIDEAAIATARAARYRKPALARLTRGAARQMVRRGRRFLPPGARDPRDVRVLGAQRDQGSAVLEARPDLLPQPADLSRRRLADPRSSATSTMGSIRAAGCSWGRRRAWRTAPRCSTRSTSGTGSSSASDATATLPGLAPREAARPGRSRDHRTAPARPATSRTRSTAARAVRWSGIRPPMW